MKNKIEYKENLRKIDVNELKKEVEKECWIALRQYFNGAQNKDEAKIGVATLAVRARELQAENNKRSLELMTKRIGN